jgi:hypothetical protein
MSSASSAATVEAHDGNGHIQLALLLAAAMFALVVDTSPMSHERFHLCGDP